MGGCEEVVVEIESATGTRQRDPLGGVLSDNTRSGVYTAVVPFIIRTIHTCTIFDITIIVVMSELHVRIMCRCIT